MREGGKSFSPAQDKRPAAKVNASPSVFYLAKVQVKSSRLILDDGNFSVITVFKYR
jgi:hypothetical protein